MIDEISDSIRFMGKENFAKLHNLFLDVYNKWELTFAGNFCIPIWPSKPLDLLGSANEESEEFREDLWDARLDASKFLVHSMALSECKVVGEFDEFFSDNRYGPYFDITVGDESYFNLVSGEIFARADKEFPSRSGDAKNVEKENTDKEKATESNELERAVTGLDRLNLEKVLDVAIDIDHELQMHRCKTVSFSAWSENIEGGFENLRDTLANLDKQEAWRFRLKGLIFLSSVGAIKKYETYGDYNDTQARFEVTLEPQFRHCLNLLKQEYQSRLSAEHEQTGNDEADKIIYSVSYSQNREISVNNFLLTQLTFDGENHIVFEYVFRKPNENITLEEIQKANRNIAINKPLTKIVENWGFTGDLKKVFFEVSKAKIKFRNPIYEKDLKTFNITRLRFPRQ